jgi:hypothetical protein
LKKIIIVALVIKNKRRQIIPANKDIKLSDTMYVLDESTGIKL